MGDQARILALHQAAAPEAAVPALLATVVAPETEFGKLQRGRVYAIHRRRLEAQARRRAAAAAPS